jgi:hypothetical protein
MDEPSPFYTWEEIKKELSAFPGKYLYRGQRNLYKILPPTLYRFYPEIMKDNNLLYKYYLKAIKKALDCKILKKTSQIESFKGNLYAFFIKKDLSMEKTEVLENIFLILQHYGIPTHMQDVTHNLFIAAYFATFNTFEKISKDSNPCILRIGQTNVMLSEKPYPNILKDKRIESQEADFVNTLNLKGAGFHFKTFYIDHACVSSIFKELKDMKFNGYHFFGPEKAALDLYNEITYGNKA